MINYFENINCEICQQRCSFNYHLIRLKFHELKFSLRFQIKEQHKQLQHELFDYMESYNKRIHKFLNSFSKRLTDASHDLKNNEDENYYISSLSDAEKLLDSIQRRLSRMQKMLEEDDFAAIQNSRIMALQDATNQNIDILSNLREQIVNIDYITNNSRSYVEISQKYSLYNRVLIGISVLLIVALIVGIFIGQSSFFSILSILLLSVTLIMFVLLRKDKKYIMNKYFK